MVIKILYCIFLGALVVLFVGWAMAAWYPTPQWETEYPGVPEYYTSEPSPPSAEELKLLSPSDRRARVQEYKADHKAYEAWQKKHDELQKDLSRKVEKQGRNVALISLLFSVVVTAIGVGFSNRLPVISEGLLLGGLFTLIYSIGWSFVRAPKIAVLPVGVGLIVMIALGYKRFVRKPSS